MSETTLEWLAVALTYTGETQLRDRALVQVLGHGLRAGDLVSLNVGQLADPGTARLFAQPAAAATPTSILTAAQAQQKTSPVSTRLCDG